MTNWTKLYQAYLAGYRGDNYEVIENTERQQQAHALGVYHRISVRAPMMLSVEVNRSLPSQRKAKKTHFDVVLTNTGANFISAIKAVREVNGFGLKDAKALVDKVRGAYQKFNPDYPHSGPVPQVVQPQLERSKAEAVAKLLRDAGCTVEIR